MKALIICYSYSGNTRKIAEMIHKKIGGDIAQIETVTPYTGDYNTVVDQGQREVNQGYMPDIKPLNKDLADYDTVVIVDPISQRETLKAVATEKGTVRHGLWKYYDSRTGKMIKEEDYQADQMIYQHRFDLTKEDSLRTQQQIKNLPHSKEDKGGIGKDSINYRSKIVADTVTKRRR